ncbi:unannotated protein [freshwater metagenome]|jgi:hypothetical protein|uniref:Unannotated protein n=1 Tax=freshwater metagenome TaxID=449393 RepID=A0A6J7E2E5_9ZZZZ|nr:DUF3618 domain-containing protein [Actinomycetota bacterium]
MSSSDQAASEVVKPQSANESESVTEPTPDELEAMIVQARERLAESVDSLADAANPMALAETGLKAVKDFFIDPETGLRTSRVAKVAGGVVGFLLLRGIIRRGS